MPPYQMYDVRRSSPLRGNVDLKKSNLLSNVHYLAIKCLPLEALDAVLFMFLNICIWKVFFLHIRSAE